MSGSFFLLPLPSRILHSPPAQLLRGQRCNPGGHRDRQDGKQAGREAAGADFARDGDGGGGGGGAGIGTDHPALRDRKGEGGTYQVAIHAEGETKQPDGGISTCKGKLEGKRGRGGRSLGRS